MAFAPLKITTITSKTRTVFRSTSTVSFSIGLEEPDTNPQIARYNNLIAISSLESDISSCPFLVPAVTTFIPTFHFHRRPLSSSAFPSPGHAHPSHSCPKYSASSLSKNSPSPHSWSTNPSVSPSRFFPLQNKLDPRLAHRGQIPMMRRRIGVAVSSRCWRSFKLFVVSKGLCARYRPRRAYTVKVNSCSNKRE
jgi:hypothetical protein